MRITLLGTGNPVPDPRRAGPSTLVTADGLAVLVDCVPEVIAAYDAPFPDDSYKAGARIFPSLVPSRADDPGAAENREAWKVFEQWEKPWLCAFNDQEAVTRGGEGPFLRRVPGAQGQPHTSIKGGGHFLQEDKGPELAALIAAFIESTPASR